MHYVNLLYATDGIRNTLNFSHMSQYTLLCTRVVHKVQYITNISAKRKLQLTRLILIAQYTVLYLKYLNIYYCTAICFWCYTHITAESRYIVGYWCDNYQLKLPAINRSAFYINMHMEQRKIVKRIMKLYNVHSYIYSAIITSNRKCCGFLIFTTNF